MARFEKGRVHSYRTNHLEVFEIGLVDAEVSRKNTVCMNKGMGADEKIGQDMEPLRKHCLTFRAGNFKGMTASTAGKPILGPLSPIVRPS
jgi:hypothetical protein